MIRIAKMVTLIFLLFLFSVSIPEGALSTETSPGLQPEVDHLLTYIEKSGCQFYRNGTWYKDPKAVRDHVEMKYHYFTDKGQINSTEDFVKWSATKSEISGKPYLVKCNNGSEMRLGQWLMDELGRHRKDKPVGR